MKSLSVRFLCILLISVIVSVSIVGISSAKGTPEPNYIPYCERHPEACPY